MSDAPTPAPDVASLIERLQEGSDWVDHLATPERPTPSAWTEVEWLNHWREQRRRVADSMRVSADALAALQVRETAERNRANQNACDWDDKDVELQRTTERLEAAEARETALRQENERLTAIERTHDQVAIQLAEESNRRVEAESAVEALRQAQARQRSEVIDETLTAVRRDIEANLYTNTKSGTRQIMLNVVDRVRKALAVDPPPVPKGDIR